MDNRNCYWCDYDINKVDTPEEGYYCTFDLDNKFLCPLDTVCPRYIAADKVPDYLRYLIAEYKLMERWLLRLP